MRDKANFATHNLEQLNKLCRDNPRQWFNEKGEPYHFGPYLTPDRPFYGAGQYIVRHIPAVGPSFEVRHRGVPSGQIYAVRGVLVNDCLDKLTKILAVEFSRDEVAALRIDFKSTHPDLINAQTFMNHIDYLEKRLQEALDSDYAD
jgi:hypothetical protein